VPKLDCDICLKDINKYYDLSDEIVDINQRLLDLAYKQGSKFLSAGRVVVLRDGVRRSLSSSILSSERFYPALPLGPCFNTQDRTNT
jgi:antiviral helicase SKI2